MNVCGYILLIMSVILASCKKDDTFSVEGELTNGATINMRAIYYDNSTLQNAIFPTDKGKFTFKGNATKGVVVELLTNDYKLLGRFYAQAGDKIKIKANPKSPAKIQIEGNEVSERWAKFLNKNAGTFDSMDALAINTLIEKYVKANPDDLVSTLLVITSYNASINPVGAEKLLATIKPQARPEYLVEGYTLTLGRVAKTAVEARVTPFSFIDAADSLATFNPSQQRNAMLVFTNERSRNVDSVRDAIHNAARKATSSQQLRVVDFSLASDTLAWHRLLREDTLSVKPDKTLKLGQKPPLPRTKKTDILVYGWAAGSLAAAAVERLGIPSLPYFIVVDSTGTQIYRGTSVNSALKALP